MIIHAICSICKHSETGSFDRLRRVWAFDVDGADLCPACNPYKRVNAEAVKPIVKAKMLAMVLVLAIVSFAAGYYAAAIEAAERFK